MIENRSYVVRPLSKAPRADMKDLFWVYLSSTSLVVHGLKPGDACQFETAQGVLCSAIVWDNKIQDAVVQTSRTFQGLYNLKLGDKITLRSSSVSIADALDIVLRETSQGEDQQLIAEEDRAHWAWILKYALMRAVYLCPGLPFDEIEVKVIGQKRSFQIFQINGSSDLSLYRFQQEMNVSIRAEAEGFNDGELPAGTRKPLQLSRNGIAGLDRQIARINRLLASCDTKKLPGSYPQRLGGMIVHGPPGTGKSLILNRIGLLNWRKVLHLDGRSKKSPNDQISAVRQVFVEARQTQPSVILIPRLEAIAGKASQDYSPALNLASILSEEIDALGDAQVLVFAETRNVTNVDDELRNPERLDIEIETTVPDSQSRQEILRLLCGLPKDAASALYDSIGLRSHGYVGADLLRLIRCAKLSAIGRVLDSQPANSDGAMNEIPGTRQEVELIEEDFEEALREVRPSALREVFLQTPNVRWGDIGGQGTCFVLLYNVNPSVEMVMLRQSTQCM